MAVAKECSQLGTIACSIAKSSNYCPLPVASDAKLRRAGARSWLMQTMNSCEVADREENSGALQLRPSASWARRRWFSKWRSMLMLLIGSMGAPCRLQRSTEYSSIQNSVGLKT